MIRKKKKLTFGAVRFKAKNPYRASQAHFYSIKTGKLLCNAKVPFAKQRWQTLTKKTRVKYEDCCHDCYWSPSISIFQIKDVLQVAFPDLF